MLALGAADLTATVVAGAFIAQVLLVALIVGSAVAVWIWRHPERGIYVLFGASTVLPMYYSNAFPDYVGQFLPFFLDISMWTHTRLIVSVNELFMALVLLILIIKSRHGRARFDGGMLMLPLGLYMLMVGISAVHGLLSGGTMYLVLWEIRAQVYLFVAYILTCSLIRSRDQVWALFWILVIAVGLRAVEGTIRFFVMARGHAQELYPHEQSFFFNGFLTLYLILLFYRSPPRLRRVATYFLPFVAFITLANERRAAIAALGVAWIALGLIVYVTRPEHRNLIRAIAITLAIVFPPYYLAFQHQNGSIALPARAVASFVSPTARDALSDQYRNNEDADIRFTMKTSPIYGYGFGKPMLLPYPLPDISKIYVFWNIMPHNSILWVWMRLGTIGYLLFWFLIGQGIIVSLGLARRLRDPRLQGIAVFVALMIVQEVIFGYLDLQWVKYGNLIAVGVLLGLLSRLPAADSSPEPVEEITSASPRQAEPLPMPRPFSVADGKLRRTSIPR